MVTPHNKVYYCESSLLKGLTELMQPSFEMLLGPICMPLLDRFIQLLKVSQASSQWVLLVVAFLCVFYSFTQLFWGTKRTLICHTVDYQDNPAFFWTSFAFGTLCVSIKISLWPQFCWCSRQHALTCCTCTVPSSWEVTVPCKTSRVQDHKHLVFMFILV